MILLLAFALSGCADQSTAESHIIVSAVDAPNSRITMKFEPSGQTRTYDVDGLTMIEVRDGPGILRSIGVGERVYSFTERKNGTLDGLIVGWSNPNEAF